LVLALIASMDENAQQMIVLPSTQDPELTFSTGFIWERHYVKRAATEGRMLYFRISVPLIVRCLADKHALSDPVRILNANDALIQDACRRAFARSVDPQETNFDLREGDFASRVVCNDQDTRAEIHVSNR